jgi:hypothetical protein
LIVSIDASPESSTRSVLTRFSLGLISKKSASAGRPAPFGLGFIGQVVVMTTTSPASRYGATNDFLDDSIPATSASASLLKDLMDAKA